jgi:hypothetical protein
MPMRHAQVGAGLVQRIDHQAQVVEGMAQLAFEFRRLQARCLGLPDQGHELATDTVVHVAHDAMALFRQGAGRLRFASQRELGLELAGAFGERDRQPLLRPLGFPSARTMRMSSAANTGRAGRITPQCRV